MNAFAGLPASLKFCATLIAAVGLAAWASPSFAQSDTSKKDRIGREIERYCSNISDAARDKRHALQLERLQAMQKAIEEKTQFLTDRTEELREWLGKRNRFLDAAESRLVDIYKNMRPDTASQQLAELDPIIAAAVLMKLNARSASAILNEMGTEKAAQLASIMASAAAKPATKKAS